MRLAWSGLEKTFWPVISDSAFGCLLDRGRRQVEPNIGPKLSPKWAQVAPNMALTWAQIALELAQAGPSRPKSTQVGPKVAQTGPKVAQTGPKLVPSWPQVGPPGSRWGRFWPFELLLAPLGPSLGCSWAALGPLLAALGPLWDRCWPTSDLSRAALGASWGSLEASGTLLDSPMRILSKSYSRRRQEHDFQDLGGSKLALSWPKLT